MAVQIGGQFSQLVNLMAQVLNHHFQVGHMVVGQALDLLLLADLEILLLHLRLKLQDTVLGPGQFLVPAFQLFQGNHRMTVVCQIPLVPVPVDVGLEGLLHPGIHCCMLLDDSEIFQKFQKARAVHPPLVTVIEIVQQTVAHEPGGNGEVEDPLVIDGTEFPLRLHPVFKQSVQIGCRAGNPANIRNISKYLRKSRRNLKGRSLLLPRSQQEIQGLL